MKMLVVIEGGSLEVIETETPQPAPGELLVNIAVSAICGSEVKGYKGGGGVGTNHGHEGAGVVTAVGEGVDSAWIGKRVGCSAISGCGQCQWCAQGAYTWCTTARKFHSAMHADFVTIPPMACYELPDIIGWEVGALVSGDGFGVPFHTDRNIHNPDAAKTVAIFGLGPIGLGSVMLQHHRRRRIIGVDLSQTRLDFATKMGADHVIRADEADAVEEIKKLTDGLGADLCIEAVGVPATLKQCFKAVKTGGQILLDGEQGDVPLSPSEDFIRRDITASGCWFYHFSEIPAMCDLALSGFPVGDLITHSMPAERAPEGFDLFAKGQTGKVALHWSGDDA